MLSDLKIDDRTEWLKSKILSEMLNHFSVFMHYSIVAFDDARREGTNNIVVVCGHNYGGTSLTNLF
jgi:hypothetical protein